MIDILYQKESMAYVLSEVCRELDAMLGVGVGKEGQMKELVLRRDWLLAFLRGSDF